MTLNEAIQYCLKKTGAIESYPFDEETLVFKVSSKMFGLVYDRQGEVGLNLKCDPELSLVLRQQYKGVVPGYHMSKKHWNTVIFGIDVPDEEVFRLIDISYELVFKSLTKKEQKEVLIQSNQE